MKINLGHILLTIVLLFSMSYYSYGQNPCPPGEINCRNLGCIPRDRCGVNPPPPGLVVPIDNHMGILLAAGLGLGIYFLVSAGKRSRSNAA